MATFQNNEELKAGTGFMLSLGEVVDNFVKEGYSSSFIPCENHFENAKHIKILPEELCIDNVVRIENTSDPDDSCILYAISVPKLGEKGLYIEPHGIYHDNLSDNLRNKLCEAKPNPYNSYINPRH